MKLTRDELIVYLKYKRMIFVNMLKGYRAIDNKTSDDYVHIECYQKIIKVFNDLLDKV